MATLKNEATKSQCHLILEALKAGQSLTPLEALNRFGCFRLGARIWDLRNSGYDINKEMVLVNDKRVAKYTLIHPQTTL